jgi:penicillin amidase
MLGCEWAGWLDIVDPARHPQIVDPPSHRLWSANARVADGEALQMIGDGGYALGARQRQIRDALLARDRFSERDLLAIQLDDRALFLEPWYRAFRARVEARRDDAILQRLEAATRNWEGRASVDSVSYRVARAWRQGVMDRIASGLTAPAQVALGEEFVMPSLPQLEGVAWQLLQQRPAHLLPRRYASWDALLDDAALEVAGKLAEHGDDLAARRWGERNTARICHPIARALPALAERWLCMPAEPLAGDVNMPRVVGPDFGASQRMVVSPGHEADGIIHMPGGQSGHPLSPFWGAGHDDWVQGRASAFLPGPTQYRLELRPQ